MPPKRSFIDPEVLWVWPGAQRSCLRTLLKRVIHLTWSCIKLFCMTLGDLGGPSRRGHVDVLRGAFPQHTYLGASGPQQYSVPVGDLQLIALDTTVHGQSHGALDEARLDWLSHELDRVKDRAVVIAMHHPPFTTLIGHMDDIGLREGRENLARIVAQHANIERIICGHLHRAIDVRFGGTIASTSPAPAHQVVLDLDPDAISQWNLEPGGFRIHAWTAQTGLITHTLPVGSFEGPYPFHMDGVLID